MTATGRLIGIVFLAALVAAAGTLFGALAVPEEHSHGERRSTTRPGKRRSTTRPRAAHEAETPGAGDFAAALLVSVAGVGIVPVALRSARRRNELERLVARPDCDVSGSSPRCRRSPLRVRRPFTSPSSRSTSRSTGSSAPFFIAVAIAQLAWAMLGHIPSVAGGVPHGGCGQRGRGGDVGCLSDDRFARSVPRPASRSRGGCGHRGDSPRSADRCAGTPAAASLDRSETSTRSLHRCDCCDDTCCDRADGPVSSHARRPVALRSPQAGRREESRSSAERLFRPDLRSFRVVAPAFVTGPKLGVIGVKSSPRDHPIPGRFRLVQPPEL